MQNDVFECEYQIEISGGEWSKGKSSEAFNPLGPWLVWPSDIGDGSGLRLHSFVNGDRRQDSTTSNLIFDVSQVIYEFSQYVLLEPGDVNNTGTPQGSRSAAVFHRSRPDGA